MSHKTRLTRLERARPQPAHERPLVFAQTRQVAEMWQRAHGRPYTLADLHTLVEMTYASHDALEPN